MYPQSVITKNKKGEKEVRYLVKNGKFILYRYLNPKTGKPVENGKMRLVLKSNQDIESYFLIPLKQSDRYLALKAEIKKNIKIWDGKRAINL